MRETDLPTGRNDIIIGTGINQRTKTTSHRHMSREEIKMGRCDREHMAGGGGMRGLLEEVTF